MSCDILSFSSIRSSLVDHLRAVAVSISRVGRGGHEKQEKSIRSLPQIASGPIPGFADPRQERELPEVWEGVHACNEEGERTAQ